jgi:uncharacterized protein YdhG (YjbR/CyaY superfamily)
MDSKAKYNTVDQYIDLQAENTKAHLNNIREVILTAAPKAIEQISYGMPAYKIYSVLVYFAANKNHIGFYPTASPIQFFEAEFKAYKTSKGAIQFPLNTEIPKALVEKIVMFRIEEDEQRFLIKNQNKIK